MIFTNDIDILYEDNHLLVVEKPANMPVQPDASGDLDLLTMLKDYIKRKYDKPGNVFLGLVHRIDRPAAGLMVFARTSKAASRLSGQLRNQAIGKIYLAAVSSSISSAGQLIHFIEKDHSENKVHIVPEHHFGGKRAELSYQTLEKSGKFSLVRIDLKTGRSHQIRVQFATEGHPLYGDRKYNPDCKDDGNLALFASELIFEHPTRKEVLRFRRKPPPMFPWTLFDYLNKEATD